jgi:hypothetical protein
MQPVESCHEREVLEARYRTDVRAYCDALSRLYPYSEDEPAVYEDVERARLAVENARAALDKHLAEHGCG